MVTSLTEYHITKYVKELYSTKEFADVTLVCDDGTQLLAHKLVLSAGSDVFQSVLRQSVENHIHIHLTGIEVKCVKLILQFLYLGKVTSHSDTANELQVVVESLNLKDFAASYEKYKQPIVETDKPFNKSDGNLERDNRTVHNSSEIEQKGQEENMHYEEVESVAENDENLLSRIEDPNINENENLNVSQVSSIILRSISRKARKKKSYFCPECPKVCNDSSNLKRHIRSWHQIEKVACDQCGQWYKVDCIKQHKKTHGVRENLICSVDSCEQTFISKSSLKHHVDKIHREILHPCTLCDFKAVSKASLSYHKDVEHCKVSYPCNICDYKSFRKQAVRKHMRLVHFKKKNMIENRLKCVETNCKKTFGRKHDLKVHIQADHQGIVFPCDKCDKKVRSKATLKRHMKTTHENEDHFRYPCTICSYQSKTQKYLSRHIQIVHGTGIPCRITYCNETFQSFYRLRDHIKVFHEGLSISCTLCDFQTTSSFSLNYHKRIKHENRKFKCGLENCNESFKHNSTMRIHIKNHHKNLILKCPERDCKSFFTERKNLDRHFEYSHTMIDKVFNVKRHALRTPKKMVECDIDGSDRSNLNKQTLECTENDIDNSITSSQDLQSARAHKGTSSSFEKIRNPTKKRGRPKGSQNEKQKIRITNVLSSLEEKLSANELC